MAEHAIQKALTIDAVFAVVTLCACDRSEQQAFAALAEAATPPLVALQPTARIIFDPAPQQLDAARACRESRSASLGLTAAGFDRVSVARGSGKPSVFELAARL